MTEDEEPTPLTLAEKCMIIGVVAGSIYYVRRIYKIKKKTKLMNEATDRLVNGMTLISDSAERLSRVIDNPDTTVDDLQKAMADESAFLTIARNYDKK